MILPMLSKKVQAGFSVHFVPVLILGAWELCFQEL